MSRTVVGIAIAISLAIGGWALAQQDKVVPKISPDESASFVVVPTMDSAILLDAESGKTWKLTRSRDRETVVWLPVERLNSEGEVTKWKIREKELKAGRSVR